MLIYLVTSRMKSMSSLIMLSAIVVIVTILSYFAVNEENRLKSASVVFVSMLLVTFGTISEELGEITTELIQDGESWMRMIQDRNLTIHSYNRATADAIAANIQQHYFGCFQSLRTRLQIRLEQEDG